MCMAVPEADVGGPPAAWAGERTGGAQGQGKRLDGPEPRRSRGLALGPPGDGGRGGGWPNKGAETTGLDQGRGREVEGEQIASSGPLIGTDPQQPWF